MPSAAPTPCREPGCPKYAQSHGFCEDHQSTHRQRRRDVSKRYRDSGRTDPFYESPTWRRTRAKYISKNPLCSHCAEQGVVKSADVVDHIVERKDGGADLDWSNLQSLCHPCHNTKTAEEKRRRDASDTPTPEKAKRTFRVM